MNEPSLEERVARLERQLERQIDDTILLTDTVFNLMELMGQQLDDDEERQHVRQMAVLIRQQREKGDGGST
jgi:hypothetical protein